VNEELKMDELERVKRRAIKPRSRQRPGCSHPLDALPTDLDYGTLGPRTTNLEDILL